MSRIVLLKDVPKEINGTTLNFLRKGAKSGILPSFRIGNRIAFDIDLLEDHLRNMALENIKSEPAKAGEYGKLRKVGE
jgi:hypothetical protein